MSYLRLSRDDYRTVSRLCYQLDLAFHPRPAFRRLLVEALRGVDLDLAGRVARLGHAELKLLQDHFRHRHCPVGTGNEVGAWDEFSPEEREFLAEACVSAPFPVRFVRPFKRLLVEMLHGAWPDLARKVARLSGRQFELLYERACRRKKGPGG
jgi:hypothetical protein